MKISGLATRISCIANNLVNQPAASNRQAKEINRMVKQLKVLSKQVNDDLIVPLKTARESAISSGQLSSSLLHTKDFGPAMTKLLESRQQIQKLRVKFESIQDSAADQLNDSVALIDDSKRAEIVEALEALVQFESSIEIIRFFSLQSWKLKLFLNDIVSKLEKTLASTHTAAQTQETKRCIASMSQLIEEVTTLVSTFEAKQVGNLKMMDVYKSAEKNHHNACKSLEKGKTDNSKLLLALAQRHQLGEDVAQDIQTLQALDRQFNQQFDDTITLLNQLEQQYSDAAAETLEAEEALQAQDKLQSVKSKKTESRTHKEGASESPLSSASSVSQPEEGKSHSSSTTACAEDLAKGLIQQGHARIDWVKHDVRELSHSNRLSKREKASAAQAQLDLLENQLAAFKNTTKVEDIKSLQQKIDDELSELSTLLEQAKLLSETPSPAQSTAAAEETLSPRSPTPESIQSLATSLSTPRPLNETQIVVRPIPTRAVASTQPVASPAAAHLSWLLPHTINHLNAIQARMDYISNKQQTLKLQLLHANQPHHPAWEHLTPAIQELEAMRETLLNYPHFFAANAYQQSQMPLVETLRFVQTERLGQTLNPFNAIEFLENANYWLNAFNYNFDRSEMHTNAASFWLLGNQNIRRFA